MTITADLDWGLQNWNPAQHPRDRHGKFTGSRTTDLTEAELQRARGVMANFKPKKFSNGAQADAYLRDQGGGLTEDQRSAVDTYTGDAFLDINRSLRSGKDGGDGHQSTIKDLRAAMRPTQDDLILNRTVSLDAFPPGALDSLKGKKVKDAAFSSTALGVSYGGNLGNVQIKIAVPKGTPAIFAAAISRNPHEREILLPDGMEFAVASVTKNDHFGYDMGLIVLPKASADEAPASTDAHHHPHIRNEDGPPDVDLSGLDERWRHILDQLLARWADFTAAVRAQLRKLIGQAIDDDDLPALARLEVDATQGTDTLHEALLAMAAAGAVSAVSEGEAAGVTLTAAAADGLGLGVTAEVVAVLLADDLANAAGREALRQHTPGKSGDQVAADVDAVMRQQSTAQAQAQLGGALTGASNAGRVATFLSGPVGSLYQTGVLDKNQCGPCKAADGRFVCTTEDLTPYNRLFTKMGGYVDCLGGPRCRCAVTGVWRPEQAPESERPGVGVGES